MKKVMLSHECLCAQTKYPLWVYALWYDNYPNERSQWIDFDVNLDRIWDELLRLNNFSPNDQ